MYEFNDLSPRGEPFGSPVGIEAVTYDGHQLDSEINGFLTLFVEGREDFKRDINSAESSGDGTYYLSSRIEERELVVNFTLESNSIDEYNSSMKLLKQILRVPNKAISFADDPEYHFIGTPKLEVDAGTLNPKGTITFTVNNPFKIGNRVTVNGTTSVAISNSEMVFEQLPDTIKLIMQSSVSVLNIINSSGKIFKTTTGLNSGDVVEIDFNSLTYIVNKADQTGNVALSANFGDFYIKDGDMLTVNGECTIELKYSVKSL